MRIKTISTEELRRMYDSEGLILQGCGGDLNEWVDGINEMLNEDGILQKKTKFNPDNVRTFEHDKLTCLLFPFDDSVKLSMSMLAIWRLKTHDQFGGTWLSDFVQNSLGGFAADTKYDAFEKETERLYDADTHVSPDFQCDQTGGFPVSLCVNWNEEKAWLALNYSIVESGQDVSAYEQMCADFGIRQCCDIEQFNGLLRELGPDAIQSAELFPDSEDMEMQL